jgi:hypothetical protein
MVLPLYWSENTVTGLLGQDHQICAVDQLQVAGGAEALKAKAFQRTPCVPQGKSVEHYSFRGFRESCNQGPQYTEPLGKNTRQLFLFRRVIRTKQHQCEKESAAP